jgi:flagellar motor switch protein FliN/FliY
MTKTAPTVVLPDVNLIERATRAAAAVAPLLPSAGALVVGDGTAPHEIPITDWSVAAVADFVTEPGLVGVLVRDDLTAALAAAPNGGLDLGAAVQPALDAAAATLGFGARTGRSLAGPALAEAWESATVAVPLLADGTVEAVLFLTSSSAATAPPTAVFTAGGHAPARGVELLHGVAMEVTVELGRTRLSVRELLALSPGDVLELDRAAGSPADLLVNGRLIARGEVVVVDEDFALRVTEIVANPAGS